MTRLKSRVIRTAFFVITLTILEFGLWALLNKGADENGAGRDYAEDQGDGKTGWKLAPLAPDAAPVDATKERQGFYRVGSRITDKQASAGEFYECDNYPFDLDRKDWGVEGAVSLIAFTDESTAYSHKLQGMAVRLINRSDRVASFPACDSALMLVQEALAPDGNWQAIESWPTGPCGNSDHRVFIKPGQYWQLTAPVYAGPLQTKLRFRLDGCDRQVLYSNEFAGAISATQFKQQVGVEWQHIFELRARDAKKGVLIGDTSILLLLVFLLALAIWRCLPSRWR
jgi:hypothetical protein